MKTLVPFALLLCMPLSPDFAWAEPRPMPAEELADVTGGLLDFYHISPVVVVSSNNSTQAGASHYSGAQASSAPTINVATTVNLTSITGLTTFQQPSASGNDAPPSMQMPVWVPWQQQLRPLGALLGPLMTPTP
jgi:hypothetical protein